MSGVGDEAYYEKKMQENNPRNEHMGIDAEGDMTRCIRCGSEDTWQTYNAHGCKECGWASRVVVDRSRNRKTKK